MKSKIIIASLLLMGSAFVANAQTKVIAHRGYWKCDGSAQNSITSLERAAAVKVYGTEFDVHLTADNKIVVNHDDTIQGHDIATTNFETLRTLKLSNGENLSTLDEYLEAGKKHPEMQMILEIKPHRTKVQEDLITKMAVDKVKAMGMEKQTEYISFSMNVCEELVRLTPNSEIAYLGSDIPPMELKAKGINGIDYYFKVLLDKPQWISEAHQLDMKVNAWTVNDLDVSKRLVDLKLDFLTTNQPEEVLQLVKNNK